MMCQRWQGRRHRFRPADPIDPGAYRVEHVDELDAKTFVLEHHYARSYPAARWRVGLFERGTRQLVGVAVFSQPVSNAVITSTFPGLRPLEGVELGRFVLLDRVPGNGESWFLGRCFDELRGQVAGVVSYSDQVPRSTAAGEIIFPGHVGTIYQAHNAAFLGLARPATQLLMPDGTELSARAISKVRNGERGQRHVIERIIAAGAERPRGDLRAWLEEWLPRVTRKRRHPGRYKYAWRLDRTAQRHLRASARPYPRGLMDARMPQ